MVRWLVTVLALAGCGDNLASPAAPIDAADLLGPWGPATPLDLGFADDPSLTGDRREIYFNASDDIYVATRASTSDPWGTATVVAELSTASFETTPEVSRDGLTMYLASDRPGGTGATDIYVSTRATRTSPWSAPTELSALDSTTPDGAAWVTPDGLIAVIGTDRKAGTDHDLYLAERTDPASPWPAPIEIAAVNSPTADWSPALSDDGLTLYFYSYRSGGGDLYVSYRSSRASEFSSPNPIEGLTTEYSEADPWISADGRHIVFATDRDHPGSGESLFEASR